MNNLNASLPGSGRNLVFAGIGKAILLAAALAIAGCGGGGGSADTSGIPSDNQQGVVTPGGDSTDGANSGSGGLVPGGGTDVTDGSGVVDDPDVIVPGDTDVVSGSVALSWSAPTERVDGSALPLEELAGYRIYHGTEADPTANVVEVNDPAVTTYELSGLESGTYVVAVSAVDTLGHESSMSNSMVKTIE